jgi:hypothetical protein
MAELSARVNVADAAAALRALAGRLSGASQVAAAAAAELVPEVDAAARAALAPHTRTGRTAEALRVRVEGSSIVLEAPLHARFLSGWPYRDGLTPVAPHALDLYRSAALRTIHG